MTGAPNLFVDRPADSGAGNGVLLAAAASQLGIRRFLNCTRPDDGRVRRILSGAGFETSTVYQEGVLRTTFSTVPEHPAALTA